MSLNACKYTFQFQRLYNHQNHSFKKTKTQKNFKIFLDITEKSVTVLTEKLSNMFNEHKDSKRIVHFRHIKPPT